MVSEMSVIFLRRLVFAALVILGPFFVYTATQAASAQDAQTGLRIYKTKATCNFCHGWAGDGNGHPRSPGDAPSLRTIDFDDETLSEIIMCGRVGTEMPFHDRMAYRDDRCYGLVKADLDPSEIPAKGKTITARDLADLVAYLRANVVGQGKVTRAQCEAYWRPDHPTCRNLKN
jgi:mono/diheme cytochrome c family protein